MFTNWKFVCIIYWSYAENGFGSYEMNIRLYEMNLKQNFLVTS